MNIHELIAEGRADNLKSPIVILTQELAACTAALLEFDFSITNQVKVNEDETLLVLKKRSKPHWPATDLTTTGIIFSHFAAKAIQEDADEPRSQYWLQPRMGLPRFDIHRDQAVKDAMDQIFTSQPEGWTDEITELLLDLRELADDRYRLDPKRDHFNISVTSKRFKPLTQYLKQVGAFPKHQLDVYADDDQGKRWIDNITVVSDSQERMTKYRIELGEVRTEDV